MNIELEMHNDSNRDNFISSNENGSSSEGSSSKKKCRWIIITLAIILLLGGALVAVYFLTRKPGECEECIDPVISDLWPEEVNMTKTKEIFSPSFKINSKLNNLIQLSQKSFQKYESNINGQKSTNIILNKVIYDIYTINSTLAPKEYNITYTTMYTTVITVNSLCSKVTFDFDKDDCELEEKLNLNKRNDNNLEKNEENPKDLIRKAILPICIVEHTDTNIIFSITCPETLSKNFRDDILRAFSNIKPCSIKGFDLDKEYADTRKEEKNDKIYINSFDNICSNPSIDPSKTMICNLSKNVITDKEGNVISSKISNVTKTIIDENNFSLNNFTYEFKNIPKENSDSFDEVIYKTNLDSIFSLTKEIMKKEILIANWKNIVIDMMIDNEEETKNGSCIRNLYEKESGTIGIHEENIFNKTIFNVSMDFSLKNDIGLEKGQSTKAVSTYNINQENYTDFSNYRIETKLNDILNKFISISNSANNLANKFKEEINEPILKMRDKIDEKIGKINSLLANKDLSEIFDSTLAIKELKVLPFSFVSATDNLSDTINELYKNILYTIDNERQKLKDDVNTFLENSHNLIFKLFNNLTELADILSSDKSKIVEIASFYLNDTDTSYYEILSKVKDILDNYYKEEKNLILPLINYITEKFYNNTIHYFEKYQTQLDHISDRLDNGDLIISLANTEDYKKCINNIFNAKIKANEIIEIVKNKFNESIGLQPNGYFETQNELEQNNQSYGIISEKATSIAYTLDNNELIDYTYDKIMNSFREKFLEVLNYMENSIKQKFPLEENVLGTSLFNSSYLFELDDYLKSEKINIIKFVQNENEIFLQSLNEIIYNFTGENGKNLDQLISELFTLMTDIYFDNLNRAFNDSLYFTFNNITYIIEKNSKLANDYFSEVINHNSFHITQGFINKYNTFYNSIQEILNFVTNNLKIDLTNNYKNIISKTRALLQSIKSNSIIEKYHKQLPFTKQHLNSIKELFEIFNRHISDNTFNEKFLSLIPDFIENTSKIINNTLNNFQSIYNNISQKTFNNILNDYDQSRIVYGYRYCSKRILGICVKHRRTPDVTYYDGYYVLTTNNTLELETINYESYMEKFNNKYNELYPKLSENVLSYNTLLSNLDNELESKKNEFMKPETSYLDNIYEKAKSIIDEKLGNNLLNSSYIYFKNKIENTLPNELNNILEQWKNIYDEIYNVTDLNKDKFKSSVYDFFYLGNYYLQTYTQNISYSSGEIVIEKLKNDFIYTNKYYYNLIISKLNQTFSYIQNNLPVNDKPFDDIINMRLEEIKNSQNKILNELKISKGQILNKTYQEINLQINSNNFFDSNDIIKNHIKEFNTTINEKIINIYLLVNQIGGNNPEELVAAKFYLENSINGKQIKEIYKMINKVDFFDFHKDVYQNLINELWKIERDGFIKNVINILNKLNENNKNNFDYEFEKYYEFLQNKLYKEFYTKDKLIEKINELFSKGINKTNENSKILIDELLNNVLNNIIEHITNESIRLTNELTSYSNNYTEIENRLNYYKDSIYNQFYSVITYVVNDFNEHILEKFYKNYIDRGLKEFEKNLDDKDFGTAKFLNMSINLNDEIDSKFKKVIIEYRNLTLNQIKFLYQKNIQELDEIFSFSDMKIKINNIIDNVYNSTLLPILEKVAIFNSTDEGVSNYDLSEEILININNTIIEQLSKTKNITKETEGEGFIIENIPPADFSGMSDRIYDLIVLVFKNFSLTYTYQEKKEFNKLVGENVINNFKELISNFIPSFGMDFFDRILKYNEIQKIDILYNNLKYSLIETIIYYIGLAVTQNSKHLPVDIKLQLYNLNNIDSVVIDKNNYIISSLNNKFEIFIEETKNYIVNKYINEMITSEEFDLKFNINLIDKIKEIINGNIHNYENEYNTMIKEYIKTPFIEEYNLILNEATENMKNFIGKEKIELKAELDNIFSLDTDVILAEIQYKLNNTIKSANDYNKHFTTFKISDEVINFLNNFGEDILVPKYKEIKELLDKKTAELVLNNLENLSSEYRNEYSIEYFEDEVNKANNNFSSYFNHFNELIREYGYIEDVYKENLDKEIAKNTKLRLLNEGINNNIYKTPDIKLDKAFTELKHTSSIIKEFILSFEYFSDFEDNIKKYTNEKNKQNLYTIYNLEKNKNENNYYDLMIERLNELNKLSLDYYSKVKIIYDTMKEQIINNTILIDDLLNLCQKVTYDTINNKYIEIKEQYNKIEDSQNTEKEEINIDIYETQQTDNYFIVETKVENYLANNKFYLDIIFEGDKNTPKILGKIETIINPKKFDIDFYSPIGQKDKLGRDISIVFNNIISYTNFIYDAGLNQAIITTNFNYDEYSVKTQYYEEKTRTITKVIAGMTITIPDVTTKINLDTPDEEKFQIIPSKNKTYIEKYNY